MFHPGRTTTMLAAGTAVVAGLATASAPASTAATRYQVSATLQPSTVLVGHRATVTGTVAPRAPQARVKLQVATDGVWHTVSVAVLTPRSHYAATYTPPAAGTYSLRVRKPAGNGHRRGTSKKVVLTVTPSLPPI
jgi:hypothetical protein